MRNKPTASVPFLDLNRSHRPLRREMNAVFRRVTRRGDFVLGGEVAQFEEEYGTFLGSEVNVVGVGNGTDAIEIALRALDLTPGSEVLVPANSFIASAIGAERAGLSVRFVDPDPETLLASSASYERAITSRTSALMVVHLFGHVAPMAEILELARRHDLKVIEDAAQAQGAKYGGKSVGALGDVGATSFYPGKNLGAFGDGGAVMSRSPEVARKARKIRNLGSEQKYVHESYGFNSRLDTLQAGVLRVKLRQLDKWNMQRTRAARLYDHLLTDLPNISRPLLLPDTVPVFHLYPILSDQRDDLQLDLERKGITTLIHYPYQIPQQFTATGPTFSHGPHATPVAEEISKKLLSLPMFPGIHRREIHAVAAAVKAFHV